MGPSTTKLLPGLYVGSLANANNLDVLEQNGITHVLSIITQNHIIQQYSNRKYLRLCLADSPDEDITTLISTTNDFIHEARKSGGSCLVHCVYGISRSVTICVAYLMTLLDLGAFDATASVRGFRHIANPNYGFCQQLRKFGNAHLSYERMRFFLLHDQWSHLLRDKAIQQRGWKNYYHFIQHGIYGDATADEDEDNTDNKNLSYKEVCHDNADLPVKPSIFDKGNVTYSDNCPSPHFPNNQN